MLYFYFFSIYIKKNCLLFEPYNNDGFIYLSSYKMLYTICRLFMGAWIFQYNIIIIYWNFNLSYTKTTAICSQFLYRRVYNNAVYLWGLIQ